VAGKARQVLHARHALLLRLVREHRAVDGVTDGVDRRHLRDVTAQGVAWQGTVSRGSRQVDRHDCPPRFTFVWKWWSTLMRPTLSVSMPNSSKPKFFVNGRRPVLTSTTSASSTDESPPADGCTVSLTPSAVTSVPVTFVLNMNFIFCFFKIFMNICDTSLSIDGVIVSRNSTTVTSEPNRLHTEPISRPMTPPPMTTIFFGT